MFQRLMRQTINALVLLGRKNEKSCKTYKNKKALEILSFNIFKGAYCCHKKCYFNGPVYCANLLFNGITRFKYTLFPFHYNAKA